MNSCGLVVIVVFLCGGPAGMFGAFGLALSNPGPTGFSVGL